eukprot:9308875-Alexandrium_andersonii.AAC.1
MSSGIFTLQGAQNAIRNPPDARQCSNPPHPQSAMPNMQHRFRRSNLELRGPRNGLQIGPRSPPGEHAAPFFAEAPNLTTKAWIEGV